MSTFSGGPSQFWGGPLVDKYGFDPVRRFHHDENDIQRNSHLWLIFGLDIFIGWQLLYTII